MLVCKSTSMKIERIQTYTKDLLTKSLQHSCSYLITSRHNQTIVLSKEEASELFYTLKKEFYE